MASVPGTTFEREIYNAVLAEVERQAVADSPLQKCTGVMQVIYAINLRCKHAAESISVGSADGAVKT